MRCYIFHEWGKWSVVKSEKWKTYYLVTGLEKEHIKEYQERYCEKCGKYQKRYTGGT